MSRSASHEPHQLRVPAAGRAPAICTRSDDRETTLVDCPGFALQDRSPFSLRPLLRFAPAQQPVIERLFSSNYRIGRVKLLRLA